jgi:hypothetical protein
MPLQRIDLADLPLLPWKNGGGSTRQLAIYPADAGLDNFAWRISCARMEHGGPFSNYPGIDRSLALLAGTGLHLRRNDHELQLQPCTTPLFFAGEDTIQAEPLGDGIEDLNLMTRRDGWSHQLQHLHLHGEQPLHMDAHVLLLWCNGGQIDCLLENGHTERLQAGQGLLLTNETQHLQLLATEQACLYLGRIQPI